MRKKYLLFLLIFVFAVVGSSEAQRIRKYSNEFLNLGMGAPGMAMANARVAGVDDLYSAYYNPAGLSHIRDAFQIGYMHSEYFAGIAKMDYFGLAIPIEAENRALSFTFFRFGVDDIPNTLFLFEPDGSINYNRISSFSIGEYAMMLSYGQKLPIEGLSLGGNIKVIHKKVGPFATAWGFGIDGGVQYRRNNLKLGLLARDITTTYNAWAFSFTNEEQAILVQTNNEIPSNSVELTMPMFLMGAAYEFNVKDKFFVEPELNVAMNTDGRRNVLFRTAPMSIDMFMGLQLNYLRIVYLRTGLGNFNWVEKPNREDQLLMSPNIGVGLNIKGFRIDYAFTNLGNNEAFYSNVISAHFGLNKKLDMKQAEENNLKSDF
jgi:hypothetical protein